MPFDQSARCGPNRCWFNARVWCRLDFDPLDVTKTWPEDLFPLQPVGRMVLNRNVDNFFQENEMVAFCPAIIVPGERMRERCLRQPASAM